MAWPCGTSCAMDLLLVERLTRDLTGVFRPSETIGVPLRPKRQYLTFCNLLMPSQSIRA
jgi:hypothetical protein